MIKKNKKRVTITLKKENVNRLYELAEKDNRTISQFIENIIEFDKGVD